MTKMDWERANRRATDSEGRFTTKLRTEPWKSGYCNECGVRLVGGKGGNIDWMNVNGKWKPGPCCKGCSIPLAAAESVSERDRIRDASPVGKVQSKRSTQSRRKGMMK